MKRLSLVFFFVILFISWNLSADVFDENAIVDCSEKNFTLADEYYYEKIRHLSIDIDEWARIPNRFQDKILKAMKKRQLYYDRWLGIICRCQKDKLDNLKKSLCLATGLIEGYKKTKPHCIIYK
ncbi:MAG: hypothetical protein A3I75_07945 [Deltaproteobacteria bacterium RIFCSPLOWO2_02_FULL_50_16]|nr:MAG: hypothetical protein A3I75_07945 [Deltaproteobacteria bacterium RIFCSPLOWO2_02_FULL_50_16]